MLFIDHLNDEETRRVRKIVHAESFGLNEVDIQPNGTIYLSGYFTPHEIELIDQIAKQLASKPALH
jgi:hypothetical protein